MRYDDLRTLSDQELVASLKELTRDERRHLVAILRRVAELDARDVATRAASPSLIEFCKREFGYEEGEAARRVHVARAAARYPVMYRLLDDGRLSLSAASTLTPHLDRQNYRTLLRKAIGASKREVEKLVAPLRPEAPPPERVRYVGPPTPSPTAPEGDLFAASAASAPDTAPPAEAAPPPDPRVQFSFTAPEELLKSVERAKELLRRKYPFCRLEDVFVEAVEALLDGIDPERRIRRKEARSGRPEDCELLSGPNVRRIPRAVRDVVWKRDGGACAYVGPDGMRCGGRLYLEYDHIVPWAMGGRSDDPDNIRLLCRRHNDLEARRAFGDATIDAAVRFDA